MIGKLAFSVISNRERLVKFEVEFFWISWADSQFYRSGLTERGFSFCVRDSWIKTREYFSGFGSEKSPSHLIFRSFCSNLSRVIQSMRAGNEQGKKSNENKSKQIEHFQSPLSPQSDGDCLFC
jgi:hypothetical protein